MAEKGATVNSEGDTRRVPSKAGAKVKFSQKVVKMSDFVRNHRFCQKSPILTFLTVLTVLPDLMGVLPGFYTVLTRITGIYTRKVVISARKAGIPMARVFPPERHFGQKTSKIC